jgi:hypothetical protein
LPELSLKAITPKRLFKVNEAALTLNLRTNMESYLNYVRAQMQEDYNRVPERTSNNYKAKPPIRKYKRTNRLQRGWKVSPVGFVNGTMTGIVYNNVSYAGYVQGPNRTIESEARADLEQVRQSRKLRKRGWRSISDVARQTRKRFDTVMNRSILGIID